MAARDITLNVDEIVKKDLTVTVSITAEQTTAILAEWLKGQGVNVEPGNISPVIEQDFEEYRFDGFKFPMPMSVSFKAPRT